MSDRQEQANGTTLTNAQIATIIEAANEVRIARKVLSHKLIHLDDVLEDVGLGKRREQVQEHG
ncbi:hypothetical protein [Polyangium spumosum]|uniref:Uncharacterized protein n=1 Tax=Polyangium spumosum TaxID=889282 RepID=A0A6N7PNY4_9BACT|nr:hypothetical protein [Polyangium spumosum]MRG93882.1 hypothetical protein [Polyangium spumosum]